MPSVNKYVAEILQLEVRLLHARARLLAGSDSEALHDLRIATRRIRSLLIPVRHVEGMDALKAAAAEVGRLTTPTRDLEVMAEELEKKGLSRAAASRRLNLVNQYRAIAVSPVLDKFFAALDAWPSTFRSSKAGIDNKKMQRVVSKSLDKQLHKLHMALDDQAHDRHQVRILVKRTRYLTEAFREASPLSAKAAKSLKAVQAALGSWHDHHQWCLRIKEEADLAPVALEWEKAAANELLQAEGEMKTLRELLP